MESIIAKFLYGELSLDEQHKLTKWLQSNRQNAETFRKIYAYWHIHKENLDDEKLEVRSRIHQLIETQEDKKSDIPKKNNWKLIYRVAASILIFSSIIVGIYNYAMPNQESIISEVKLVEKVSLPGQKVSTTLSDGTIVKMNADSKLIVPSRFNETSREVTLEGEAFFDVTRNEEHPFIIKTGSVRIRVLGTSFNVKAYEDETLAVSVRTGKVAVIHQNDQSIQLVQDQVVYLKDDKLIKSQISDSENPFAWTDQQLVFKDQSLDRVLKNISRWYGYQVKQDRKFIKDKNFTAHYDNPTLNELLDVLSFVYVFKYEIDEREKLIRIY